MGEIREESLDDLSVATPRKSYFTLTEKDTALREHLIGTAPFILNIIASEVFVCEFPIKSPISLVL